MKNQVLSNIIRFIDTFDVKSNGNYIAEVLAGDVDLNDFFLDVAKDTPNTLWGKMLEDFKFDEVSEKLFENLSDALVREDYMSVSILRKEIINRWEQVDEEYIWEKGRHYLFNFKKGFPESNLFKHMSNDVKQIEHLWVTQRFEAYDYILEGLEKIKEDIEIYPREEIWKDIRGTTGTGIETDAENIRDIISHPYFTIDEVLNYFRILHK